VTATAGQAPSDLYTRPAELLQRLIRFDTTNPPGNERECIAFIDGLLREAGFETTVLAREPERPNLLARLAGRGAAPPLLLHGHVDVVTTAGQRWSHPPFEGVERDGFVWGRGAVDMKGGVAMMLSALLRARAEGLEPVGDVIFCALADEENMSGYGAEWLVRDHPERFAGVRHAIGEFGGFTLHFSGRRFYPIQVAEKQICTLRATVRGRGGHGAMPVHGAAMARLARMLGKLDRTRLPIHVTPVVRDMVQAMAAAMPLPQRVALRSLVRPAFAGVVLDRLGDRASLLDPILHNTVSPTILETTEKFNVIPSEIGIVLDGRLLPGLAPDVLIGELRDVIGEDVELELLRHDPGPSEPDLGLFATLAGILAEADPGSAAVPLLMPGVTDGRFFSRLGIQTYGFLPMRLPRDFDFWQTVHAADERIPVDAIEFGAQAVYRALERFGESR
jgi:acetylornithine deacetylase/succinyl-diaminopimelate desuccinylase-like protein